jgi:hypothetical protein
MARVYTFIKPILRELFQLQQRSIIYQKGESKMKKSQLFLVLASLGSMFISIVPALVQTNRRLGMKREIEQRLDTFGKR